MRLGALVPTLMFAAALLAPPPAGADHNRSPDRDRSGYERSGRGDRGYDSRRSHRRGHERRYRRSDRHRRGYHHGRRPHYRGRHYYSRPPRPYHYGPRYYRRPAPPVYYAPRPVPYGYPGPVWAPPRRGGVHGSVSVGLPFFGLSLYF